MVFSYFINSPVDPDVRTQYRCDVIDQYFAVVMDAPCVVFKME